MIIWWGVYYLRKKNVQEKEGNCQFCNKKRKIKSYDGTKWHHVYSIPLIPHGRKKVTDHCVGCDQLIEMPLDEWNFQKDKVYNEARKNYSFDKKNQEYAVAMHKASNQFGTFEESEELALELEKDFTGNSVVIQHLASWYFSRMMVKKAIELYHEVLRLKPGNNKVMRTLGILYLLDDDLLQSKEYYLGAKVLKEKPDLANLIQLAVKMRKNDKIREAYEVFRHIIQKFPDAAARNYNVRREIPAIEKNLGIPQTILPAHPGNKNRLFIIAGSAAAFAALIFAINIYLINNQTLYIVNNLLKKASITLNKDTKIELSPGESKEITIPENEYTVSLKLDTFKPDTISLRIRNSIYQRFIDSNIYILDIKGASVFIWEKILYSAKENDKDLEKELPFEIYTGKEFYILNHGIDYLFEEPPKEIELEGTDSEIITSLRKLNYNQYETINILLNNIAHVKLDNILSYMEGQIEGGYKNSGFISLYKDICMKEKLVERSKLFFSNLNGKRKH